MQDRIANLYLFLLRTQAAYAAAFVLVFALHLPAALDAGAPVLMATLANLAALGLCACITVPQLMPDWLARPAGDRGLRLLPTLALLPLLLSVPTLTAMATLPLEAETARALGLAASLPNFVLSGVAALLALALCLSPRARAAVETGAA